MDLKMKIKRNNKIGVAGIEPTTSYTPCKRATRLRYTPKENIITKGKEKVNYRFYLIY